MKVLVAQWCQTHCDPVDYSPPGSSVHGISQARVLEWVCHFLLQGIFLTKGWKLALLHYRRILDHSSHQEGFISPVWCYWSDVEPTVAFDQGNYYRRFSVQFSRSVVSNSLSPHELQHARPPCLSQTPRVDSNSCPSSQ